MALSWEDVVNKQFQPTKFREGYDQTEVDDFLDEIVAEFKRLIALNEQLESENAELRAGGAAQGPLVVLADVQDGRVRGDLVHIDGLESAHGLSVATGADAAGRVHGR